MIVNTFKVTFKLSPLFGGRGAVVHNNKIYLREIIANESGLLED